MNITIKTIDRAVDQIRGALHVYRSQIDEAFLKSDSDQIVIGLGITFKVVEGQLKIVTPIKFVTDQVKDSFEVMYDPNQEELFQGIRDGNIEISINE